MTPFRPLDGADGIEIWAGIECTVNRVHSVFHDQCKKSGHFDRISDLKLFADLGIKKIRYPFLWEIAAPESAEKIDWTWIDQRAKELKKLGIDPIAGFVHHGSGPVYTSLMDPEFPEKLKVFAGEFARRFPWITDYTPINEPLTTARFSGLYGVWYPHGRSDEIFVRCLYNQMKAIVVCMQAIREVNPQARLIQTDDLGRAQATPTMQYQADFENERRWLSFDFLTGRITPKHPFYSYLTQHGLTAEELNWFEVNKCPPDVLGLNHYLLSNRFFDERLEFYPEWFRANNGKHQYVDIGVVDTTVAQFPNPSSIFEEAWDRYQLPIAITEVHVHGPRESQIRWLHQIYEECASLKNKNVDIIAITPWSLLGSFEWNSLCTQVQNFYESGIFDVRSPQPRPTALARMIKNLTGVEKSKVSLNLEPGWWMDPTRAPFGPRIQKSESVMGSGVDSKTLLITGANGTLAKAFTRICEARKIPYRTLTREELNISDLESVKRALEEIKPWAVINSAGYVRVDQAESEQAKCFVENVQGPQNLALACAIHDIPLIHFSSDLVFDGQRTEPYLESHPVAPLNIYGESKAASEKAVLDIHAKSLILRTSSFFGPWDQANFAYSVLKSIALKKNFHVASDITVSPTYVPDLVAATLDLLIDGETGILHLTNEGHLTWAQWAQKIAEGAGQKLDHIIATPSCELQYQAKRPQFSALSSERLKILPPYEKALERYFGDLKETFGNKMLSEELNL